MHKSGYATVLGQRFEVRFSEHSDEYWEARTQAELNAAAKASILHKLNELTEIQNEEALITIHHA
jgi:hypothetical protein